MTMIPHLATQKLVGDLDLLNNKSNQTPEDTWRSRILLRSAEQADQDIRTQIQYYTREQSDDPTVRASFGQIHRDFKRVHATFRKHMIHCKYRLGAGLSLMPAQPMISLIQQQANEEDFFDRAMKERELEGMMINGSINQVNDMYQKVPHSVVIQQEEVEDIDDDIQYSRAATQLRDELFKNACARRKFPFGASRCDVMDDNSVIDHHASCMNSKRQKRSFLACGDLGDSTDSETEASTFGSVSTSSPPPANDEGFAWVHALKSVRNDIIDFHKDVVGCVTSDAVVMGAQNILTCGSTKDVDHE